jgi:type IV pilus assembly protein PilY1
MTYNGTDAGIPFRYDELTTDMQDALKEADWGLSYTQDEQAGFILDYVRGRTDNVSALSFRYRTRRLGDIVHSAPLLVGKAVSANNDGVDNDDDGFADAYDPGGEYSGGTIFAGGNDGMLHAFNAQNGWERFAYVPNLVFDNLKNLKAVGYSHQFYVDKTPYAKEVIVSATRRKTYLVGGLGKGGKGYYCLLLRDRVLSSGSWADSWNVDNVGDSTSENSLVTNNLVQWEYPRAGVTDDDMGYSFSEAYIVKTNSSNSDHRWVVIFGNGYNSVNNKAVLYVLDLDGNVIRKIDTGVAGDNGLSTPALVDVNNDQKLDYVYAGDLKGNMWKFDLTDSDSTYWDVAYNDGTDPKPLFPAGKPITSKPDIMRHCSENGYMVIFGTGKYLHNDDRTDTSQQTIYGIWDYGDDDDDSEYLGSLNHTTGALSSPSMLGSALLKQTVVDLRTINGDIYRTFSDNEPQWHTVPDTDSEDQNANPTYHVGWYVDFPNASPYEGERVFKNILIRDGKAYVISFIPDASPCSGGGNSFLYVVNACTGGRLNVGQFEIGVAAGTDTGQTDADGNTIYAEKNTIVIETAGEKELAAPTGKMFVGTLHEPKIIRRPGTGLERLYMSSSTGVVETEDLPAERRGVLYWLER